MSFIFFFFFFPLLLFAFLRASERYQEGWGSGTVLDAITQPRASVFRTLHLRLPLPFIFDVVQSAVMETITSRYTTPFSSVRPLASLLLEALVSRAPRLARSFEGTSFVNVAGVEGYHRVLYHISYYNTACYNPCCRVSIGFALFFSVFGNAATDDDRHVCVRFLSRERSRG